MVGGSAVYRTRCAVHGLGNPRFLCGLLLPNQRHAPPGTGVVSFCMSGPIFESMSENMDSRPGADRTGTDRHLLHPSDRIRDPRMGVQYVCPFDHQRSALFCFARK